MAQYASKYRKTATTTLSFRRVLSSYISVSPVFAKFGCCCVCTYLNLSTLSETACTHHWGLTSPFAAIQPFCACLYTQLFFPGKHACLSFVTHMSVHVTREFGVFRTARHKRTVQGWIKELTRGPQPRTLRISVWGPWIRSTLCAFGCN